MSKFIVVERKQIPDVLKLYDLKMDNAYVVLSRWNDFADICQYSSKYDSVHLLTVPAYQLDPLKEFK